MASAAARGALTKHGFPRGYCYAPECLEILQLLADQIHGRPLPPPVARVFHEIRILEEHPQQLYEMYKEYAEDGFLYFFSWRKFLPSAARAACDDKKRRPVRAAKGGAWKPSGGGKDLKRPLNKGGGLAGKKVTMVFYERLPNGDTVKTSWGMHEYTVPDPSGLDKFSDLAVYRLYKVKNGGKGGNVPSVAAVHHVPSTSATAAAPPSSYAAGTSATGQELSTSSQEQKQLISIEQQVQHHHNPYAAMPGQRIWAPPPVQQQEGTKPGYFQFVSPYSLLETTVNTWQQQPPTDQSRVTRSPPAEQRAPAMEAAPSQPEQLVMPAEDEEYDMAAPFNEGSDVPVDGGVLDPFDDFLRFDGGGVIDPFDDFIRFDNGSDIAFSLEELIGTDNDNPSGGDGTNNQAF